MLGLSSQAQASRVTRLTGCEVRRIKILTYKGFTITAMLLEKSVSIWVRLVSKDTNQRHRGSLLEALL